MRKAIMTLALAALFALPSFGQSDTLSVRRVDTDSLVTFLREELGAKIFVVKDGKDENSYTVSAPRANFVNAAVAQMHAKGYNASFYDGAWYLSNGLELASSLPLGYFNEAPKTDEELLKYVTGETTTVEFQNKVYEIGDERSGKTGKVHVHGYVKDVSTGEPIIGVSVMNPKTSVYSITDGYGYYNLLMPVGEGKLAFDGYTYEPVELNLYVYDDGGLDVNLKEKVNTLKEVIVSAESAATHRDAKMGVENIRISTLTKVPVAFGEADVLKVVTTLPGVKTVGEASSGFNVRGGSVDQNLILFNDGTIYNPSHLFGIFSAFNTEVINDVQLYKSSIPAEFGGRISSVLDIRGREGSPNKLQGSVGLGLLTSRFHLEGPFKKGGRTTFLIGGRTTYSNWMLKMIPESSGYHNGKANFYDLNASISHHIDSKNSIHAYAYYSSDKFAFSGDTTYHYSNANASIKWRSNFSERHSLTMSAGYDEYSNRLDNTSNANEAYKYRTHIRQAFWKTNFKSVLNEKHTLTYGINSIFYIMDPGSKTPFGENSIVVHRQLDGENAVELGAYVSDSHIVTPKLSFEYGLRLSGFTAFESPRFYGMPELRLSAKYSILPNLSVKGGVNTMRQYIHLVTNTSSISPMDTWKICDRDIRPQDGWQTAAGVYWTIGDSQIDLSLEGYYKQTYNYLDYKSGAILIMNENLAEDLVRTRGQAYGAEIMLKKPHGKLNGWISYTYSRSLLKEMFYRGAETINGGNWYSAPHDKPHDLKFVGNYKFTHRYSISMNIDYSTGRPMTVPVGKFKYGGDDRLAYSERNAYRIPDYFRMDLAMMIEPSHYLKSLTHFSITFGVYNVTARKNAYSVYFNQNEYGHISGYMLSVFACPIPYININMKF
ncbi:MAG: TonB-dependent receptor [Bacteroidales bacterium]|nr:TonB-dependent receptor [Bacteroidales bacterium]